MRTPRRSRASWTQNITPSIPGCYITDFTAPLRGVYPERSRKAQNDKAFHFDPREQSRSRLRGEIWNRQRICNNLICKHPILRFCMFTFSMIVIRLCPSPDQVSAMDSTLSLSGSVHYLVFYPRQYSIKWDGIDNAGDIASSGIYFYCLLIQSGRWTQLKKVLLLK